MKPRSIDRLKMRALLAVRHVNRAAIEKWSLVLYRRGNALEALSSPDAVEAESASTHYGDPDIPPQLLVAKAIPKAWRLGRLYVMAYYYLAGTAFKLYQRAPMPATVAWDPSISLELASDEGWNDISEDAEFAQLRLQGPNPYLLCRAEDGSYVADYAAAFAGVHAPVRCRFAMQGERLMPTEIDHDGQVVRPGDAGWAQAKLVANSLDARYAVFVQHLLRTHLIVGQVYALSAAALDVAHPIGAFLRLHTYGTLHVNDFAWRLLLAPSSYFIQAHFITREQALTMFRNALRTFHFDELIPEVDVANRGIGELPGHPYAADAMAAWRVMYAYALDVASCYASDAAVEADPALAAWHARLVSFMPNPSTRLRRLATREDLATLLAVLVFNNVTHEVSGDFSVFVTSKDPHNKRLVNLAPDAPDAPVSLNDAFLFEQGAFSGMFNPAGNSLMGTPLETIVKDDHVRACMQRFREHLAVLDGQVASHNLPRRYKFQRLRPRQWDMSISF